MFGEYYDWNDAYMEACDRNEERLAEVLQDMSTDDIMTTWNSYCDRTTTKKRVYTWDTINEAFAGEDASCVLYHLSKVYAENKEYVYEDGDNFKTCDDLKDTPIDYKDMASYALTNEDDLDSYEVGSFLYD